MTRAAAFVNLALAPVGLALLLAGGPRHVSLLTIAGYGLDLRVDALSVTLVSLIAFVGAIAVRFSRTYFAGEPRRGRFLADLCLTLAAVSLLVLSGNLLQLVGAWIATSFALRRLLLVFRERPGARAAARKEFWVARLSDACLLGAATLLLASFSTPELGPLLAEARALAATGEVPMTVELAALLLVLAACLKSAQLPSHGWLLDVAEAPTPVSAILHAGLINAGGFLLVRFADVVSLASPALILLGVIAAFTALLGSLVMLTQTSVKLSLAWSTVAQMGFMLFQCALGAYASAILHLVAHSLYKAHAFFGSGRAVAQAPAQPHGRAIRPALIVLSFVAALAAFALAALAWGVSLQDEPAILALGSILVLGLTHVVLRASEADPQVRGGVIVRAVFVALLVSLAYFGLQRGAASALAGVVPEAAPLELGSAIAMGLAVLAFALVTATQWLALVHPRAGIWQRAYVHLKHGLYLDARLDRWLA